MGSDHQIHSDQCMVSLNDKSYYVECGFKFRLFHGFRLDNCHNTPIHVAEVLLTCYWIVKSFNYVIILIFELYLMY